MSHIPRDLSPYWLQRKWNTWGNRKQRTKAHTTKCWPAHHSLWLCIHSGEGDWEDGGWPYWGGLQMGDWFLERYMGITNPQGVVGPNGWYGAPSQQAQEFAAERAYRGSGYSLSFLYGQWPNTAPPCGSLA